MAVRQGRKRDFQALEQRRKQAARLFRQGTESLAAIGRQLKVSRQSVTRWFHAWQAGGAGSLKAAKRVGRPPCVSAQQMRRVESALRKGALAHGFPTELWSLPRVAVVIERVTGVRYHPGHVWKILGTLRWSAQKPEQQARERNPKQVEYWRTVRWPDLKKTQQNNGPGSSSKTNPASASSPACNEPGRHAGKRRS